MLFLVQEKEDNDIWMIVQYQATEVPGAFNFRPCPSPVRVS